MSQFRPLAGVAWRRSAPAVLTLLVGSLLLAAAPAAAQLCEGASSITRLGGANRFSEPVTDRESLQALFANRRDDILALLGEAGWSGDPDDLFEAVAEWTGVSSDTFEPGQRFEWMFFRRGGTTPEVGTNMCWAGREAFKAWEIRLASNGRWFSIIVPESCGNLALLAEQPMPKISLDVDIEGLSCEDRTFDIRSSCAGGEGAVTVRMPGGRERSAAPGESFRFEREGDYTVTATCSAMSSRGDRLEDTLSRTIAVGCPSCSATVSPSAVDLGESSTLTVKPDPGHGAEVSRVLLDGRPLASPYTREMTHDGADAFTHVVTVETNTGQSARCSAEMKVAPTVTMSIEPERLLAGDAAVVTVMPENGEGAPMSVTLDGEELAAPYTRDVSHRRPGEYTHVAKVENPGGSNEASASLRVDPRWTLFATMSDVSGDDSQSDMLEGTARQEIEACRSGLGIGVGAEYRFSYRLGLMFGADFSRCETRWQYDVRDGLGGHDVADLDANLLYAGLNLHLTKPGSRVDAWVGPLVGRFSYDEPTLHALAGDGPQPDASYRPQWRDETVLGLNAGLKIPFWKDCPAGAYLRAMWVESTMEAGAATMMGADGVDAPELSLGRSPLYVTAGVAFDF